MGEIQSNISSPAWWFSAVVVAFIINMLSSYAKPWTDNIFLGLGHSLRTRTEKKGQQFEYQVQRNIGNPHVLVDSAQRETRSRQRAIFLFLLGFFLLNLGNLSGHQPGGSTTLANAATLDLVYLGATIVGFLVVTLSLAFMSSADRLEDVITRANRANISEHNAGTSEE